jgi:hypothetical protein
MYYRGAAAAIVVYDITKKVCYHNYSPSNTSETWYTTCCIVYNTARRCSLLIIPMEYDVIGFL